HARTPLLAERERAPTPTARGATHLDLFHRSRAVIAAVPTAVGYTLASVGPSNGDITGTFRGQERVEAELDGVTGLFREPPINRRLRGGRLVAAPPVEPDPSLTQSPLVAPATPVRVRKGDRLDAKPTPEAAPAPAEVVQTPQPDAQVDAAQSASPA